MSIKVYQEKPESDELYLRLMQGCDKASLRIVAADGVPVPGKPLLQLTYDGVFLPDQIDSDRTARAGLTRALDANGRLKVIGQEVKAERMQETTYPAASHYGTGDMTIYARPDGCVSFKTRTKGGSCAVVSTLAITSLRDLHTAIGKYLAYLEQEGLDKP